MKLQFEAEWDENTESEWWNTGRKQLNQIIRKYNRWQINGCDQNERSRLSRLIEYGLQTFAARDGGQNWAVVLRRMQEFVMFWEVNQLMRPHDD